MAMTGMRCGDYARVRRRLFERRLRRGWVRRTWPKLELLQ